LEANILPGLEENILRHFIRTKLFARQTSFGASLCRTKPKFQFHKVDLMSVGACTWAGEEKRFTTPTFAPASSHIGDVECMDLSCFWVSAPQDPWLTMVATLTARTGVRRPLFFLAPHLLCPYLVLFFLGRNADHSEQTLGLSRSPISESRDTALRWGELHREYANLLG
jgi:hypothetical protein